MKRTATVNRATKETTISASWTLDGEGTYRISTGAPFFDHMLELLARHGFFDLVVDAKGDIEVDYHHTVEDVGIVMGRALKEALGDFSGLVRYGSAIVPMDEALCVVAVDVCGRPNFVWTGELKGKIGTFDVEVVKEFFKGFVNEARLALHINLIYGDNLHHRLEAVFKAFARALSASVAIDDRVKGALSTKGLL
jgi:imidazoleglycerol-phosphate dehydratase